MKVSSINLVLALVVGSMVLAACGGAGDDGAGSPTAFSVSPPKKGVTGAAPNCYVGYVGRFFVSGGIAPYDIGLSDPDAFSFTDTAVRMTDRWTVGNRNGSFDLWATGICVDPSSVVVFDALGGKGRTVVELTNKAGS